MRDFEQLRAFIPPVTIVPGVPYTKSDGTQGALGDQTSTTAVKYRFFNDGWDLTFEDPGKIANSGSFDGGNYYSLFGYYRTKVEWTPYARQDIAITPLSQDVAEGKNWESHWIRAPDLTTTGLGNPVVPGWAGSNLRILDIWTSEEVEETMLENLAWNMDLPGAEASYIPTSPFNPASLYYSKNPPGLVKHKLRFDQVISARYRQFVSSTNAPGDIAKAQFWGGQMVNIHDMTIGGNAAMSESIHHARYVFWVSSNDYRDTIDNPTPSTSDAFNYYKQGFFIPSSIDTLTVGLSKIESDAEWATLARRGSYR